MIDPQFFRALERRPGQRRTRRPAQPRDLQERADTLRATPPTWGVNVLVNIAMFTTGAPAASVAQEHRAAPALDHVVRRRAEHQLADRGSAVGAHAEEVDL